MAGRFSIEAVFKAVDRITAPVSRMQNRVGKFTRGMERQFRGLDRLSGKAFGGIKAGATVAAGGVGVVAGAVTYLTHEFSKIEDAQAAFTPLMGGAKQAKKLVDALNETAATTPFQFETLASSTQQLLPVMNGDIEKTVATLRMLGDTAGGNAQKLDSITRGFVKAMLKGKVDMESLNMIAEAGVPIFQDLAAVMGRKVDAKFFKAISAGAVSTKDLEKAFKKLTGEGGKFFKGMEISSRTTSGLWSTFKDNVSLTAAAFGEALSPAVKMLIKDLTGLAQKARAWANANKEIISEKVMRFFTFLRDNLGTISKWMKRIGIGLAIFVSLMALLKTFITIMTAVNLVMAMNPIGLIILAIGALIAAVAAAIIWWDDLKAAFLGLSDKTVVAISALTGPIGWFVGAAALVYKHWEPIKQFFIDMWDGIVSAFDAAGKKINAVMDKIGVSKLVELRGKAQQKIADLFGFGSTEAPAASPPAAISPQERVAKTIEDRRQTSTAEVTIKDETGRASITKGTLGPGLAMMPSGAF